MAFTFSAADARAGKTTFIDGDDDEPGEEIESAPVLQVGEEREIFRGSGIRKKLLKQGKGWQTPVLGDEVTVHYVGTLLDGTKFDFSRDKGEPVVLKLGSGQVVPGLDQGIITMRMGERALFSVPSSAGYVDTGWNSVPPSSDMKFEVELISWISVVNVSKDGGIVKRILIKGDGGQPGDLDEVTVTYRVKLPDGAIVAETSEEGVEFYLNNGHFCPALPRVVKTMEKGETASVTVQSQYAFGELGRSHSNDLHPIPSKTTLTIDLELVSFKRVIDVSGEMMVLKKILREGDGISTPNEGDSVQIRWTGMVEDGTVFERIGFDGETVFERIGFDGEGSFKFVLGEEQVISGLDRAALTMAKGEISLLTLKPEYGYGQNEFKGNLAIVPACSTLMYEVEMLDFTKEKGPWDMNSHDRLEAARKFKECGNDLFKIGKYQRAAKKYQKALVYVDDGESFERDETKDAKSLKVSCLLNSAACSLKLKDFRIAIRLCSDVLAIEFYNAKALYRRAQAYIETSDLDLAALDIKKSLEIDPNNREVVTIQKKMKELQSESNKKDTKFYGNMFLQMKDTELASKRRKVKEVTVTSTESPGKQEEQPVTSTDSSVEAMVVDRFLLQSERCVSDEYPDGFLCKKEYPDVLL